MTPLKLQKDIKAMLEDLFEGYSILSKPIQVFLQDLPIVQDDDEDEDKYFPGIIVRLENGTVPAVNEPQLISVNIIIATMDENGDMQGYQDGVIMVDKIRDKLLADGNVKGEFRIKFPIEWEFGESGTYPYFFGIIKTNWEVPCASLETSDYI